jgi:predicted NodU family carbamoyl transferase
MDIAASIQAVTEDVVTRLARHAHELTGARKLTLVSPRLYCGRGCPG